MTDLHDRLRSLDELRTPDLWHEIEERAMAIQPKTRHSPWVLIAVTLLLILAIGGAVLVGSGIPRPPVTVEASPTPSSPPDSAPPSSPPVEVSTRGIWTATANMMNATSADTATLLLDGRVLVTGGTSAELYDPRTGSWTATGNMIEARSATATLLLDGRVLVTGHASAELYDPRTGSWTATGNLIEARGRGYTATLLPDGRVLVVGGGDGSSGGRLRSAELYDPISGTWTATANMGGGPRQYHTATLLADDTVLVAGGRLGAGTTAEVYDPSSGTWTATGSMNDYHVEHTATLLPDGRVLVAGNGDGYKAYAELYDPRTGTWTATGSMIKPRGGHAATVLPDGGVLVVGGAHLNEGGGSLPHAEAYDPRTGTWTATPSMIEWRECPAATLLPDGTVLVVGCNTASAELYDARGGS